VKANLRGLAGETNRIYEETFWYWYNILPEPKAYQKALLAAAEYHAQHNLHVFKTKRGVVAMARKVDKLGLIDFIRAQFASEIAHKETIHILDVGTDSKAEFCHRIKEMLNKEGLLAKIFGIQPKDMFYYQLSPDEIRSAKEKGIILEEIGLEDLTPQESFIARKSKFHLVFITAPDFILTETMINNIRAVLNDNGLLIYTAARDGGRLMAGNIGNIMRLYDVAVTEIELEGFPASTLFRNLFPRKVIKVISKRKDIR